MKKEALIIALVGITILFISLDFSTPITITAKENITALQTNQKVTVQGIITEEKNTNYGTYLTVANLSLFYEGILPNLKGKTINALAVVHRLESTQLRILSLQVKQNTYVARALLALMVQFDSQAKFLPSHT